MAELQKGDAFFRMGSWVMLHLLLCCGSPFEWVSHTFKASRTPKFAGAPKSTVEAPWQVTALHHKTAFQMSSHLDASMLGKSASHDQPRDILKDWQHYLAAKSALQKRQHSTLAKQGQCHGKAACGAVLRSM